MKIKSSIAAVAMLVSAAFVSNVALAADASHAVASIDLSSGSQDYGSSFAAGQKNATFVDTYTFTLGSYDALSGYVGSISSVKTDLLAITGFSLSGTGGTFVGTQNSTGTFDQWSLDLAGISAGTYTLSVSGKLLTAAAASYSGNINIAAVPEPETYAMMLAGLGLVGFMARRRKSVVTAA